MLSVNDRLASLQTNGANTSQQSFKSDVGMKSRGDVFIGQFLMCLSVSLGVTWRNWLSSGGGELETKVEMLGLRRARRSRILWRMVFSLLTKKSESILHCFWLSIASKLLLRSWLWSSFCAMRHLLRASPPDSVNFLLMYSRRERVMSRFVVWQAERYLIRSWSDFVRLYRHSSCLRFRLAAMAILDNQLFVCCMASPLGNMLQRCQLVEDSSDIITQLNSIFVCCRFGTQPDTATLQLAHELIDVNVLEFTVLILH